MSSRVIGHSQQRARLARAWKAGRLAHAYLFVGPEGVGKRTFATGLAKALLCRRPDVDALEPCGRCESCSVFEAGTHPDYHEFAPDEEKNEFAVKIVREKVLPALVLKPALGLSRVTILDDAEKFNEESGNALLKTIEEPAANSYLLLVSSKPEGVLPTIRSRCQTVGFSPLAIDEVAQVLLERGIAASADEARTLAGSSGGSLASIDELQDEAWTELRPQVLERLSRPPPDAVRFAKELNKYCEDAGKESGPKRRRASRVVRAALDMYQGALRIRTGAASSAGGVEAECAAAFSEDTLLDFVERTLAADDQIKRYLHLPTTLDCWVDDLAQIAAGAFSPAGT